ncbi:MAG: hypothetical protein CME06_01605 [Gemmatimonadetes bacterium]|nr:hypothetical protein [Gemmatimonadota bacterium]
MPTDTGGILGPVDPIRKGRTDDEPARDGDSCPSDAVGDVVLDDPSIAELEEIRTEFIRGYTTLPVRLKA